MMMMMMMMMMNLMRSNLMRIFECQKDILWCIGMLRAVISTIVNFEKLPAGRKTVLWAVGMLRGPQHPRYWPTDPDFHLLKYAEPARGLPHACICDAEFWSLDFENLPSLFMESSFFSAESTCRRSLLVQAYRENALWSSEMTGRRGETGFSSRSKSRKRCNLFIIMTCALRSIWR